jgi:probable HAF family extracellular repeat protein
MKTLRLALLAVLAGPVASASPTALPALVPVDLGNLGRTSAQATLINSAGQVAGLSYGPQQSAARGFFWSGTGAPQDLGSVTPNGGTYPKAMNNLGQVVGLASTPTGYHAFLWNSWDGIHDIGTLGGPELNSQALGINDAGQVVGESTRSDGTTHGFFWTSSTGMIDLQTFDGVPGNSTARAINASGQVTGTATGMYSVGYPFLWTQAGGLQHLGTSDFGLDGTMINSSGDIVVQGSAGVYLWNAGAGFQPLGNLQGEMHPYGLSPSGQVVGDCTRIDDQQHAFYWSAAGGLQDLGTLGVFDDYAFARSINGNGLVVGYAYTSGVLSAMRWTAVDGMQGFGGPNSSAFSVNDSGWIAGSIGNNATVWKPSTAPVAVIAPVGTVEAGTLAHLDGSGSTPGVSYQWTFNGTPIGADSTLDYVFPLGLQTVTLTVTNGANQSASASVQVSVVDTTPPDTTITSAPPAVTALTSATFSFSSTEGGTFERSLDGGPWIAVTNPETLSGLSVAAHTYAVRAIDTSGNIDPTPASASWTIVNTGSGSNVDAPALGGTSAAGGMDLVFSNVTSPGTTTVTESSTGSNPPAGFKVGSPATYIEITTTATFSGSVQVSFNYSALHVGNPSNLRLFHYENGHWVDITTANNTTLMIITGTTTSFSPFACFEAQEPALACRAEADAVRAKGLPKGTEDELTATLNAAANAFAFGNTETGRQQLQVFEQKLQAQSGKKIPAAVAADLTADAESILYSVAISM